MGRRLRIESSSKLLNSKLLLRITILKRIRDSSELSDFLTSQDHPLRSASLPIKSIKMRSLRTRLKLMSPPWITSRSSTRTKSKSRSGLRNTPSCLLLIPSSKVPVVLGPVLNRIGMFPQPVTHNEPIEKKINDVKGSVKWQLKKVTCLNVAAGNEKMSDEELRQNIVMALNFLASLLKKQWHNLKAIHIKTTMGKSVKIL